MSIHQDHIELQTDEQNWYKLTGDVNEVVEESDIENGICHVWNLGSTGAIIVNENDKPLLKDMSDMLKRITPKKDNYKHPRNSFSHQWATLLGSGETIPVKNSSLALGTWQDILFYECDHRPRDRKILVTIKGE